MPDEGFSTTRSLSDQLRAFVAARDLEKPDGRPLYAYRCTVEEAATLEQSLRAFFASDALGFSSEVSQAFCIWSADFWRRKYRGGHWSWGELLAVVGAFRFGPGQPGYPALCRMVSEGLRRWRRDLLRTANGRLFLVTLACEGGLPLHLVTREQGPLRSYFRALLEEFQVYELTGALRDTSESDLARQLAGHLPVSLRQDVVFELGGRLVAEIWRLSKYVRDAEDPVVALDQRHPGWRSQLPLDLDDTVAAVFLNGLVTEATAVARTEGTTVQWVRKLVLRSVVPNDTLSSGAADGEVSEEASMAEWDLLGKLQLPGTLTAVEVASVFSTPTPPGRFDISMRASSGETELVAIGVARGKDGIVGLERTPHSLSATRGPGASEGRILILRSGRDTMRSWSDFKGALPLSDLPWVFGPATDGGAEHSLVSEGTVRVRGSEALVAAASDFDPVPDEDSHCEAVGRVQGLTNRFVYRISGTVTFRSADGTRCVVRTNNSAGDELDYRLRGTKADIGRSDIPVFLGPPTVAVARGSTWATGVPPYELQWRSKLDSAVRSSDQAAWLGEGVLSHTVGGETRFSARLILLPPTLRVKLTAKNDVSGCVEVSGMDGGTVGIDAADGMHVVRDPGDHDVTRLHVEVSNAPPAALTLSLLWEHRGKASLEVSYPANRLGFYTAAGRQLPPNVSLSVSQLGTVRAVALVPSDGPEFHVEGQYLGEFFAGGAPGSKDDIVHPSLIIRPMIEGKEGVFSLDLVTLQHDVLAQLDASDKLDGTVRLRVRSDDLPNLPPVPLEVTRYDLRLVRQDDGAVLSLEAEALTRLAPKDVEALRLEAFPLLNPNSEPVPLARVSNTSWLAPGVGGEPGPWLVIGWHGSWCRLRPMLCDVPGQIEDAPIEGLRWACLQPSATREQALQDTLAVLSKRPDDPDWELLAGFVRHTEYLPPATFDALRALSRVPKAVASAALLFAEQDVALLRTLWRALDGLPFSRFAITHDVWQEALLSIFSTRYENFSTALGDVGPDLDPRELFDTHVYAPIMRRLLAVAEFEWLAPLLDRARSQVLGVEVAPETAFLSQPSAKQLSLTRYREALLTAPTIAFNCGVLPHASAVIAHADVMNTHAELRELIIPRKRKHEERARYEFVNAPAIAAVCAVTGTLLTVKAQVQLRQIHARDQRWFQEMYCSAFLFALSAAAPGPNISPE